MNDNLCVKCGVGHVGNCHKCECGNRFTPFRKCGECLDKESGRFGI